MKKILSIIIFFLTTFAAAQEGVNIRISTIPPGASIYFNNAFIGATDSNGTKIIEAVPQCWHSIRIEKGGYETINKKIQVDLLNVNFNFTLQKNKEKGSNLEIQCNVSGASVLLNQKNLGKTDLTGNLTILDVEKGKHSLRIEKEGYFAFAETINIKEGENKFTFNLAQKSEIPLGGSQGRELVLNCNEAGASIIIDNVLMKEKTKKGSTILVLPPGNHELKIEKPSWQAYTKIITISGNLALSVDVVLEKAAIVKSAPRSNISNGGDTIQNAFILIIILVMMGIVFVLFYLVKGSKRTEIMGKFKLQKKIGKGGIATIYQARDTVKKRTVALKVMDDNSLRDPDLVYKFFIEGEVITKINKTFPNAPVVKVFDYGRDKEKSFGIPYISMELLKGESLLKIIRKNGAESVQRKLYIAREITKALKAAHSLKVYHGDITPDNVMVDGNRVVLFDFGVSFQAHDTYKNMDASITGKPVYMSPEHCSGADIDEKSDIYSLGIILFFMFCGNPPFQAQNPLEVMRMHQENPIPGIKAPIDDEIKKLIYRLLEKDPRKRPYAFELEKIFDNLIGD